MPNSNQQVFSAAKNGDIVFFQSRNVDENSVDEDGANCLHYAARGGHTQLVKYLIEAKKFDVHHKTKFGSTIFHEAAATGCLDVIKWLWTNTQINIDGGDNEGATPLHVAALYGQLATVFWIINNTSCDLLTKTKSGALCLHFAVVSGNLKVTTLILTEIPRSVNAQLNNGATAAYLACQCGHLDILKYLVEKNANVKSIKSFDGMSCLHAACQGGHIDIVKYLVKEQECNVNDRDLDGASCLHFAATNGRSVVVAWMMKEAKAKISLDNLGGSPLHNAAELGHFEVIKALLDNGCSADITDNDGLTAAELAEKCNRQNCAALIRGEFSADNTVTGNLSVPSASHNQRLANGHASPVNSELEKRRSPISVTEQTYQQTQESSSIQSDVQISYTGLNSNQSNKNNTNGQTTNTHETTQTSTSFAADDAPEFHLPEPKEDYPLDSDEEGGSSKSLVIHPSPPSSSPVEFVPPVDYEIKQIDPDTYEPPELPPDSNSEKDDANNNSLEDENKPEVTKVPEVQAEVSVVVNSRPGSALSSGTSTLSSPRHDDRIRLTGSPSSVRFASTDEIIDTPNSPETIPQTENVLNAIDTDFQQNSNIYSQQTFPKIQNHSSFRPINPASQPVIIQPHPSYQSFIKRSPEPIKKRPNLLHLPHSTEMTETVAKRNNLLSELKQLHVSKSENNLQEYDSNGETPVLLRNGRENTSSTENRPVSMPNGDASMSPRSTALSPSSSTSSLSSYNHPAAVGINMDLVNELKNKDPSDLKVTKKPHETKKGKMVFSFGDPVVPKPITTSPSGTKATNSPTETKSSKLPEKKESKSKSPVLSGDYNPNNFLDKVPEKDPSGNPYPAWKKQLLARQLAEKAQKEGEEKKKEEEYEARFKNMPLWKRQMIERKEGKQK